MSSPLLALLFAVTLSSALVSVNAQDQGWAVVAAYTDTSCNALANYSMVQVGNCINLGGAGSQIWTLLQNNLQMSFCTDGSCVECVTNPIPENSCQPDSHSSTMVNYFPEFPSKLANMNPVLISVEFKGSACSGDFNMVVISPTNCQNMCFAPPMPNLLAMGYYCQVPPFLH